MAHYLVWGSGTSVHGSIEDPLDIQCALAGAYVYYEREVLGSLTLGVAVFWSKKSSDVAVADLQKRLEKLEKDFSASDTPAQRKKSERRARFASLLAILGFVVAAIGVPTALVQNHTLSQQVALQEEALKMSGPVLKGTAFVTDYAVLPEMLSPRHHSDQHYYSRGDTAGDFPMIRIEVTNVGQAMGSITSASVRSGSEWLTAQRLFCGVSDDGSQLEYCELPIRVEPGGMAVFTYDLPYGACSETPVNPEEVIASFNSIQGESAPMATGVLAQIATECPYDYSE